MSKLKSVSWFLGSMTMLVLATLRVTVAQPPPAQTTESEVLAFKEQILARLNAGREEIKRVAEPVLDRIRRSLEPRSDATEQSVKVSEAEAKYQNARLTREVAELAVKGYEEGTFLEQLAQAEGELRLAESDVTRAEGTLRDFLPVFQMNRTVQPTSAQERIAIASFEKTYHLAELEKAKAELALGMAKDRLKSLREHEKPRRLKELKLEVEKARSDESSAKGWLQLEQSKLRSARAAASGAGIPANLRAILTPLAEAVRLDGEIRGQLAKSEPRAGLSLDELRKELGTLLQSQEAKIKESARLLDEKRFAELSFEITRYTAGSYQSP